jgi:ribosomal RNA-processing protein 8
MFINFCFFVLFSCPPCVEVLKVGGVLWIAEVRSRFDGSAGHASVESFLAVCKQLGFKLQGSPDEKNKMFFTVHLVKDNESKAAKGKKGKKGLKWPKLKACIYKRR